MAENLRQFAHEHRESMGSIDLFTVRAGKLARVLPDPKRLRVTSPPYPLGQVTINDELIKYIEAKGYLGKSLVDLELHIFTARQGRRLSMNPNNTNLLLGITEPFTEGTPSPKYYTVQHE